MNKIVLGLVVGGILGIFDGLTAWFTPAVRAQLLTIVIGSTVKGLIAGVLIGYFAKKVNSLPLGLLFGLGIGLLLAYGSRPCRIPQANITTSRSCFRAESWA